MLLLSMLIAVLWLLLLGMMLGSVLVLSLDWISGRWQRSTLPEPCTPGDSDYDPAVDGWWIYDPTWYCDWPRVAPDDLIRRWAFKTHDAAQTQFLLTIEQIDQPDPRVWVVLYGARL